MNLRHRIQLALLSGCASLFSLLGFGGLSRLGSGFGRLMWHALPARRKLAEHGIGSNGHAARQLRNEDYDRFDLLIGMDKANLRNMNRICGGDFDGKIHLLMEFADRPDAEVADPWYTGDFEATWQDVLIGCRGLLAFLQK